MTRTKTKDITLSFIPVGLLMNVIVDVTPGGKTFGVTAIHEYISYYCRGDK